ncbi:MAG: PASTA domain-containing protein [Propionibacteriaceae bacterium]
MLVTVPNVKAMGVESATKTLEDAGFEVVTKDDENLHLGIGYVSRSDPKGGTQAPEGSKITIYLV